MEPLRAILWLRWRLTRNQWRRLGAANMAAAVILGIMGFTAIVAICPLGFVIGWQVLKTAPPRVMLLAVDGIVALFLFFWLIGLLHEIQRSESIDLARLMHLPVSMKKIFLFNFVASHFTSSLMIGVPGVLALCLGLVIGAGARMLWMVPVFFGFFFLVTAWTYCLRGWLVSLMANERRRRLILVVMTTGFIVISQLPNLYFQLLRPPPGEAKKNRATGIPTWFIAAHRYVPPLWVGQAASSLASRNVLPAAAASVGLFALGGLGLLQAYRGTVGFYRAHHPAPAVKPRKKKPAATRRRDRLLETRLPWVSEETSAVALATFRSYLRAPEVKMALIGQFLFPLIMGGVFARSAKVAQGHFPVTATAIVVFCLIGAVQLIFNQFGYDRDGFRAIVLAPAARRSVLIGKNLALFPIVGLSAAVILVLALAFSILPAGTAFATALQFLAGFLLFAVLGNGLSILAPYHMIQGSLKPTKFPPGIMLLNLAGFFLSPLFIGPIFLPAALESVCRYYHWLEGIPINLMGSVLLACAAGAIYAVTISPLGNLLCRREQRILHAVTRAIE